MTFETGAKVRYAASLWALQPLNGLEGIVVRSTDTTTLIKVTKKTDQNTHGHLLGTETGFGTQYLVEIEPAPKEFKVGDRVRVIDPTSTTHNGLIGTITQVDLPLLEGVVKADIDEDCEAFQRNKRWNSGLDGVDWYLSASTLEHYEDKPKVGDEIAHEKVVPGQRIRVSREEAGVVHSREGVVGSTEFHTGHNAGWTIYSAGRYTQKGSRLNWGSGQFEETITLLEDVPEKDELLDKLLEAEGGTIIRVKDLIVFVRSPFGDEWTSQGGDALTTDSAGLRERYGDKIKFYVEETKGN